MKKYINNKLLEARAYMTPREKKLKERLIALLRDDGKGHHHAKYAERLKKFDVNIVPLSADPNFTAAISFDTGIIYIGEGFLVDESYFFQLNVLLRHELAHNLLMHQVRMSYKLGKEEFNKVSFSAMIHNLWNILMDDEISNKKYTEEDKKIVRNMYLNGRLIGGLVTEDHRSSWKNLTLEEMYDRLKAELDSISAKIASNLAANNTDVINVRSEFSTDDNFMDNEISRLYTYTDTIADSIIPGTLENFIKSGGKIKNRKLMDNLFEIVNKIYEETSKNPISDDDINTELIKIAGSNPLSPVSILNNKIKLFSPEDKFIAVETLKKLRSSYSDWYNKVLTVVSKYDNKTVKELLDLMD